MYIEKIAIKINERPLIRFKTLIIWFNRLTTILMNFSHMTFKDVLLPILISVIGTQFMRVAQRTVCRGKIIKSLFIFKTSTRG